MVPHTKAQLDGLLNVLRENLDKAQGEIYIFSVRKQKMSANYARAALSEMIKTSKELRRLLLAYKKSMPIKVKKDPLKLISVKKKENGQ